MEARPLDHRWVCYKCGASNDPQAAQCPSCGFHKPQTLPEQVLGEAGPAAEVEENNWLQILVGLPVIGAWIGFAVLLIPTLILLVLAYPVTALLGIDMNFEFDQSTGHGSVLLAVGLVHGAWLIALQKTMRVRLVMPMVPVPWSWVMVAFIVGGCLQLAGGSGDIHLGY